MAVVEAVSSADDYQKSLEPFSWYRNLPDANHQQQLLRQGFYQEACEFLSDEDCPSELQNMLWGREIDPLAQASLADRKIVEAGDILFYITTVGTVRGVKLSEMISRGIEIYTGNPPDVHPPTFDDLDTGMKTRMDKAVSSNYQPNYQSMRSFNIQPFYGAPPPAGGEAQWARDPRGPLQLKADGLYVLERLFGNLGEAMASEVETDRPRFITAAGLALGGLSAVVQNRLGASFQSAATANTVKLQRRLAAGTLQTGPDLQRSNPEEVLGRRFSGFDITFSGLLAVSPPA